MLLGAGCGRSVEHDARVSDSKGDGHGGCVDGASLLFVSSYVSLKMELEMRVPITREALWRAVSYWTAMLDARRMESGVAPLSDFRGEVLWRMFCAIQRWRRAGVVVMCERCERGCVQCGCKWLLQSQLLCRVCLRYEMQWLRLCGRGIDVRVFVGESLVWVGCVSDVLVDAFRVMRLRGAKRGVTRGPVLCMRGESQRSGGVGNGCSNDFHCSSFVIDVSVTMSQSRMRFACDMSMADLAAFSAAYARRMALQQMRLMKKQDVWEDFRCHVDTTDDEMVDMMVAMTKMDYFESYVRKMRRDVVPFARCEECRRLADLSFVDASGGKVSLSWLSQAFRGARRATQTCQDGRRRIDAMSE